MKVSLRSAIITMALGLLAGIAGMWIGHQFMAAPSARDTSLHSMVHESLKLTAEQDAALHAIETSFAARRTALEDEMRKANAELAAAIRNSETVGPDVEAAVHHFHDAMGTLQTATIEHVFAMRRVLTPEQRATFDEKLEQALTSDTQ